MRIQTKWFDQLPSTNTYLSEQAKKTPKLSSGTIIATRSQSAGRGRGNRQWIAPPNTNLCFSLYIESNAPPIQLPSLTMAAALAVTELLEDQQMAATPKWPNDILVGNKKICGILSEQTPNGLIIGIGLNINLTPEEALQIDRPASSILIETGRRLNIEQTLTDLIPYLIHWIGKWEQRGFSSIKATWTHKSGPLGRPLTVHDGEIKKTGTLAGYGPHGELLLQTSSGIETIWSGDVTQT